jgi:energy-coupling factor transporter ATP-binding protein EcfA2
VSGNQVTLGASVAGGAAEGFGTGTGTGTGTTPDAAIAADYAARAADFGDREGILRRRADRMSQLRLAAFVVGVVGTIMAATGRGPQALTTIAMVAGAAGYVVLAARHAAERRRASWSGVRRIVCAQGRQRVERDWGGIASTLMDPAPRDHAYAADLDVVGHASLARLLDVTSSGPGRRTLMAWLLDPPPLVSELRDRQAAVRELAPATDWRETLTGHAWTIGSTRRTDVERFLAWAEGSPWLLVRPAVVWAARLLPFFIIPAVVLAVMGVFWSRGIGAAPHPAVARLATALLAGWWAPPLVAGILLSVYARRVLSERVQAAIAHLGGLSAYSEMLAHVQASTFVAPRLGGIRARLATGPGAASELNRLGAIVRFAETRYSPMAHSALQLLALWDFHVLAALEGWQRKSGAHARDWLTALGEAEALSALATLAYDNPDWTTPELSDTGPPTVEARALGHPLLRSRTRVANDVTVGPPGTFVLVTGSNMSGKSTLLRAIGTNVVLAQAGGPVCAAEMRVTVTDIWTSIRIDDSLEAGVSLFMAELRRLKRIVDAAHDPARSRPLLYLLDEILHGTNTAERRIAARRVIRHLVHAGAIGAVTTHDLTLAEDPSLDAAARRVHFTERFEERDGVTSMTFDYRLRPGLATSANALKLLAMIGLGDEPAPDAATRPG